MRTNKNDAELNRGFSLVELIVSIAILAIVAAAIIAFFSMSMGQYKNNTDETSLQTESRLAWKRLESNILNANMGIWANPGSSEIDLYSYDSGTKQRVKTRIYFVEATSNEPSHLYYAEERSGSNQEESPQIFADLVTSFSVTLYDKDENVIDNPSLGIRPAKVKAHIEYEANGRTFSSDNTVAIRNNIVAADDNNLEE